MGKVLDALEVYGLADETVVFDPEETRSVAEVSDYENVVRELNALITANDSNSPWSPSLSHH